MSILVRRAATCWWQNLWTEKFNFISFTFSSGVFTFMLPKNIPQYLFHFYALSSGRVSCSTNFSIMCLMKLFPKFGNYSNRQTGTRVLLRGRRNSSRQRIMKENQNSVFWNFAKLMVFLSDFSWIFQLILEKSCFEILYEGLLLCWS